MCFIENRRLKVAKKTAVSAACKYFFFFEFEHFRAQPCWFALYQQRAEKERKKLAYDVTDTCATRASFTHDVKGTHCKTQNGSAHSRLFRDLIFFLNRLSRKPTEKNQTNKKMGWGCYFSSPPFFLIGRASDASLLGSPLRQWVHVFLGSNPFAR